MLEWHARYPEYGFDRNKGSPTPAHMQVLETLGPFEIHRRSFKLVLDTGGGMSELYAGFKAAMLRADDVEVLDRFDHRVDRLWERLHDRYDVIRRRDAVAAELGDKYAAIFEAHLQMLQDSRLRSELDEMIRSVVETGRLEERTPVGRIRVIR